MNKQPTKWQLKIIKLMRGRYGHLDQLNRHLLVLAFGSMIINLFFSHYLLTLLMLLSVLLVYYRIFSKKIYVRAQENQKYQRWWQKIKQPWALTKSKMINRKKYRYFKCPGCKQDVRVPKGKGKIAITCPKCHHKFQKKV